MTGDAASVSRTAEPGEDALTQDARFVDVSCARKGVLIRRISPVTRSQGMGEGSGPESFHDASEARRWRRVHRRRCKAGLSDGGSRVRGRVGQNPSGLFAVNPCHWYPISRTGFTLLNHGT